MTYQDEQHRQSVIDICKRMYTRGYISGTEGNVSLRISKNFILMTPSGKNKGFLQNDDLIVLDGEGNQVKGKLKPTSEFRMHLTVYKIRDDVNAVIHAHPKAAIASTIAGVSLAQCILPETILSFGKIPTAPYATPTTEDVPKVLSRYVADYDAVMMDRHGSMTLGNTIEEAYNRLESLEHTAEITLMAKILGPVQSLPEQEIKKLIKMASDMGISSTFKGCEGCSVCGDSPSVSIEKAEMDEKIINRIVNVVLSKIITGK